MPIIALSPHRSCSFECVYLDVRVKSFFDQQGLAVKAR